MPSTAVTSAARSSPSSPPAHQERRKSRKPWLTCDWCGAEFQRLLMNITPLCDCWRFSTPPLVPDVGIVASDNIVAAERAAIDLIDYRNLIESAVPEELAPLGTEGHLLRRVWGKDPYEQVRAVVDAGLGSGEYEMEEIL